MGFFSKFVKIAIGIGMVVVGITTQNPWLIAHGLDTALILTGASLALGAILTPKPLTLDRLRQQTVMIRSAVKAQELVFGRDKKSGVIVYYGTSGSENIYLWFVIAVCEHEIDGYETLWINNTDIDIGTEIDTNGFVTHSDFVDADGNKLVKTGFYTGTDDQTVDADLTAAFPADWDVDHRGRGVAYFWVRCELDRSEGGNDPENPSANVWHKGYPDDIAVTARWAKVYDPRQDSTNGGSGSHRYDDEATWEWSDNSVLCRIRYMMSSRFGPGYLPTEFNWTVIADHADTADEQVDLPDSGSQARYVCNGVVSTEDTPKHILEDMQTCDHGVTLFTPAGIECRVGRWDAATWEIDESWLAGGYQARSSTAIDDTYNAVRGQFVDADQEYTLVEFPSITASAYETEDGGGRIWEDIVLPFTRDSYTAQRLAIIEVKKSRQQVVINVPCNQRGELVQPFEVITSQLPGFEGETFRVLGKASSDDGSITLQLREEVEDDWTYTIPELAEPPVIPSVIRYPDGVPAPTALAGITRASGIQWVWAHPNLSVISHIELYTAAANNRSTATLAFKGKGLEYFDYQDPDTIRYGWVVARGNNYLLSQFYPAGATGGIEGTAGSASAAENAIFGQLNNPTDIIPCGPDGSGYDLDTAGGTFEVWDGQSNVTGVGPDYFVLDGFPSGATGGSYTANGLTLTIDPVSGEYTLSDTTDGWIAPAGNLGNAYMLRAVYGAVTIDRPYTIIKSLDGRDLSLSATAQTFAYDYNGDPKGASQIDFTVVQTNSSETVYWTCQKWNGSTWVDTTNRISAPAQGLTATLTETNFAAEGEDALRVVASFSDPPGQVYYIETLTIQKIEDGVPGSDAAMYYIKPTNGTAIKNSSGTLTVEAHLNQGGSDNILSSGTIKLYVGTTLVTVANGYATGSDGYTGVFDAGDISGDVVVLLKDGAGGTVLDSITLVDVTDGGNAVYGYIEPSGPISWTRASDQSTWTPSATTVDLDCTFVQNGAAVCRKAWRVTRSASGILTGASTTHKDGDLNTSYIGGGTGNATELNESSQAFTVKFDYDDGTNTQSVAETVVTSMAGAAGADGADGATGATGDIGPPGISWVMSNPNSSISAANDGTVSYAAGDLANTGNTLEVWEGDTALDCVSNLTGVDGAFRVTSRATQSPTGMTVPALTGVGSGTVATAPALTGWSNKTATTGYIRWDVSFKRVGSSTIEYLTIYQNFTVVRAGADGAGAGAAAGDVDIASVSCNVGTGTTTQGFRVHSDGTVDATTVSSGTYTNQYTWLVNSTDYDNSDFEVKMVKVSGLGLTSGTLDTWEVCSTTRTWYRTAASGAFTGQLFIRRADTGVILDSCTVELDNTTA